MYAARQAPDIAIATTAQRIACPRFSTPMLAFVFTFASRLYGAAVFGRVG